MGWLDDVQKKVTGVGIATNLTELYANIEESKEVLKKIKAQAETIRTQKTALQKLSTATETCWKGTSGDALRERLAALIKEQEAIAKELEQNAQSMTQAIQHLEDEDASLAYAFRQAGGGNSGLSSSGSGRRV